ncbi:MAG: hypothetical protein HY898_27425 [Deltaproteobacteria bacterium]|nr:hypothetical protein [Deltaproteobacteria bacterium]
MPLRLGQEVQEVLLDKNSAGARMSEVDALSRNECTPDVHVRILAVVMGLWAIPLLLMLILAPIAMVRVAFFDPPMHGDDRLMSMIVLPLGIVLGVYGLFLAVTARGLWKGRRWSFLAAVVVSMTWFPLGLLPFGAYGLFALLRAPIRSQWLPAARAAQSS